MSKLNSLKAEAYDLIAEYEKHQAQIREIQKKLDTKNAEILAEMERLDKELEAIVAED